MLLLGVCVFLMVFLTMNIVSFADNSTYDTHYHSVCGTTCSCSNTHAKQTWQPLPTGTTTLTSGNYYLESTINFTGINELIIDGNVSICLNGYNIYKYGTSTVVTVKSGTLTLTDCKGTGKIQVKSSDKNSFGGGGALCLSGSGSLDMYAGTVSCDALGDAIYCDTTGNLTIYNGTVSAYYDAVGIHTINDIIIYSGIITSTNSVGICCGETYYPATFHNVTISGGAFSGKKNGVSFGKYTCTGNVTISGGEFYGNGPVPNSTTYGYEYYGLAFGNSAGGSCNLIISGGKFAGARGGLYNYNPLLNVIISGGTFNSKYTNYSVSSSGIAANNGIFLIEGGTIYGIQHSSSYAVDTRITVTGGEILCIQGNSRSSGIFTLKVYGGTIGRVGTTTASSGIIATLSNPQNPTNIQIYGGEIFGTTSAIKVTNPKVALLISGGILSGETVDVCLGAVGTAAAEAPISMEGYTGDFITVALPSSVSSNAYVAKNVSTSGIISISGGKYFAEYDGVNKAVYITQHSHVYTAVVTSLPTHTTEGVKKYTCTCGDTYTQIIEKLPNHEWNSGVITTEPTCLENGIKTFTCSCGDTYTEDVAALRHDYHIEWTVDVDPTCTTNGSKSHHCLRCNDKIDVTVIPANGHSYSDWASINSNQHQRSCFCGVVETEAHDFNDDGVCTLCNSTRYISGDASGNGKINMLDVVMLSQYISDGCTTDLAGYNVAVVEDACDVTGDGRINLLDVVRLSQYISDGCVTDPDGYNVTLLSGRID